MPRESFDVIVIGGGGVGLATAYYCARAEKRVLLIEQYDLLNDRHSSKGLSRFFRIVYSDRLLCQLARSALPLRNELERESHETLITKTGVLFYGMSEVFSREGNLQQCRQVMDELGIVYESYDSRQLSERFPVLKAVPDSASGLFQEDAGFTHARTTLEVLYRLAKQHGADIRSREPVQRLSSSSHDGCVQVRTDSGDYHAEKAILTPGGWANRLLGHLGLKLRLSIWGVTYAHFQVDEDRFEYPMWFYFGDPRGSDKNLYYGLPPILPQGQIKAGADFTDHVYDSPDSCSFEPDPNLVDLTAAFLERTFHGVDPRAVDPQVCFYTMTPDQSFVLDFVPGHPNMVLFTGGTGQAFKFTPILGTILSQLALAGQTEYRIQPFSIDREGLLA